MYDTLLVTGLKIKGHKRRRGKKKAERKVFVIEKLEEEDIRDPEEISGS